MTNKDNEELVIRAPWLLVIWISMYAFFGVCMTGMLLFIPVSVLLNAPLTSTDVFFVSFITLMCIIGTAYCFYIVFVGMTQWEDLVYGKSKRQWLGPFDAAEQQTKQFYKRREG